MSDTVYMLGAGVNRSLALDQLGIPPLATDFFIQYLKGKDTPAHVEPIEDLLDYIERYFKMSLEDLREKPFDMEACFTLMDLQSKEALLNGSQEEFTRIKTLSKLFIDIFAVFLCDFSPQVSFSNSILILASDVINENASVITFNYDTIIETALMEVSGRRIPCDLDFYFSIKNPTLHKVIHAHPSYSPYNWNYILGYGVKFDKVMQPNLTPIQVGPHILDTFADGEVYYSVPENKLYDSPILKLHGSVNWYRVYKIDDALREKSDENIDEQVVLLNTHVHRYGSQPPLALREIDAVVETLIITPTSNKRTDDNSILSQLWKIARDKLSNCKKLIVVGYSFPATDFHVRRLLLESFVDNVLTELVIINPAPELVEVVKNLTHFQGEVKYFRNLEDYYGITSKQKEIVSSASISDEEWWRQFYERYPDLLKHIPPE